MLTFEINYQFQVYIWNYDYYNIVIGHFGVLKYCVPTKAPLGSRDENKIRIDGY